MAKAFKTAVAFKAALEARLRTVAQERQVPLTTLQLKLVMERLLARLFRQEHPIWLLKGGFAMELRYRPRARTTKDIDLSVPVATMPGEGESLSNALREQLQESAEVNLGDYFEFRIGTPQSDLEQAPLGGARFLCEALLAGKTYQKFHIDVGCGDAVVDEAERLIGEDLLGFAGIEPARVLAISLSQQFAEKVHAYTYPWTGRTNTRTKDLVDMVLLIETGFGNAARISEALRATFITRNTHPLPGALAPPPEAWKDDFATMAEEAKLSTTDYLAGFAILKQFWNECGFSDQQSSSAPGSSIDK